MPPPLHRYCRCISWCQARKARIINLSLGGMQYSQTLEDAIGSAGALVLVAAGNDGVNLGTAPSYPASYTLPNMLTVAATG